MAIKESKKDSASRGPILLSTLTLRLRREASAQNIPANLALEACDRTVRAIGLSPSKKVAPFEVARARSYFWAIIRKQSLRRGGDEYVRGKFLISSVVADLRSSGLSDERILVDLEEDWATRVPREVMEEFRLKLTPFKVAV